MKPVFIVLVAWRLIVVTSTVVKTFSDDMEMNHMVVDKNTGRVYVGAVNRLHQLTPDLELEIRDVTGPHDDSPDCPVDGCPNNVFKKKTNNVNKGIVIDYATSRLISCGSLFQGMCSMRILNNISKEVLHVKEAVVASNSTASTVLFIAPGPPNPPVTRVMYVGVSYTGLSPMYRSVIPAISSRSLDSDKMFQIALSSVTSRTMMFVNSLAAERYPINYVYGFASEGFAYFLTTQMKYNNPSSFISKLVRVCSDDINYYSYTEIPIDCIGEGGEVYNLVQAGFVGKPGSDLAWNLGITPQEDVLFAVFSKSEQSNEEWSSNPGQSSALCIYSLKAIRRKFFQNIKNCFSGKGDRGLDFITPNHNCVKTIVPIGEDFCGLDVNTPIGGEEPVAAVPVLTFHHHLTAVAATSTGNHTVVFVGTATGHLKKIVVGSSRTAQEYGEVNVAEDSAVNKDLKFDNELMHLYVMTERMVSKVKVQECVMYNSCRDCLDARDPYCGWCSLDNKCSLRSDCQNLAKGDLYWISDKSNHCPTITAVSPSHIQSSTRRMLEFVIDGLPTPPAHLHCAFTFTGLDDTVTTNATIEGSVVKCPSPRTEFLSTVLTKQHHLTVTLSMKTADGQDLVVTNYTIFDCNTYSNCTECVSSPYPCEWCVDGHRCTHSVSDNCRNDVTVAGINRSGPSDRSGPMHCPRMNSTTGGSTEILVPSGLKWGVRVQVHIIGQFIIQTRLRCQFNIEGKVTSVNAWLLGDTIYCASTEFYYTSKSPNVTATFAVLWGASKPLDNPNNIHVMIYKCSEMADNCGMCLVLPERFSCGWCLVSENCELNEHCNNNGMIWLNHNHTCPNPQITSFSPQQGPWEGGTNITIEGINLGKTFRDIYGGVEVAGIMCEPYEKLYESTKKIVCKIGSTDTNKLRRGQVVISVEDFRALSQQSYEFVNPIIESITPKFGPISGGTLLKIQGKYMNAGSHIEAFIDDFPCTIMSISSSKVICTTSASDRLWRGRIRVEFDKAERSYDKEMFEYVEEATINLTDSGVAKEVN